jgi:hypothetical protein
MVKQFLQDERYYEFISKAFENVFDLCVFNVFEYLVEYYYEYLDINYIFRSRVIINISERASIVRKVFQLARQNIDIHDKINLEEAFVSCAIFGQYMLVHEIGEELSANMGLTLYLIDRAIDKLVEVLRFQIQTLKNPCTIAQMFTMETLQGMKSL